MMQGTPEGVPSLVQPSGAKIDIEQLRHDIPKYNALSEGDKQWWLQFLEENESGLNSSQHFLNLAIGRTIGYN